MHHKWNEMIGNVYKKTNGKSQETNSFHLKDNSITTRQLSNRESQTLTNHVSHKLVSRESSTSGQEIRLGQIRD